MAEPQVSTGTRVVRRDGKQAAQRVSADICVVGAGIAGASAAIEAARLGRKVLLVDGMPALGGQAVNSIIGTFCGLFSNGTHGYQFTHGIADDILRDARQEQRAALLPPRPADDGRLLRRGRARPLDRAHRARAGHHGDRSAPCCARSMSRAGASRRCISPRAMATSKCEATGFVDASGDAALV